MFSMNGQNKLMNGKDGLKGRHKNTTLKIIWTRILADRTGKTGSDKCRENCSYPLRSARFATALALADL